MIGACRTSTLALDLAVTSLLGRREAQQAIRCEVERQLVELTLKLQPILASATQSQNAANCRAGDVSER